MRRALRSQRRRSSGRSGVVNEHSGACGAVPRARPSGIVRGHTAAVAETGSQLAAPTPARARRTLLKRTTWVLAAAVLATGIGYVAYVWHDNSEMWKRVRSEATHFNPPSGWTSVGRVQEGSGGCIISCDSPRVTLVYRTTSNASVACNQARAAVVEQVGRTPSDPYSAWCGWQAHIPSSHRAYVTAGAEFVSALQGRSAPSWTRKIRPNGDGTLVWVEFNSGLD